jgi:hypothetical protein
MPAQGCTLGGIRTGGDRIPTTRSIHPKGGAIRRPGRRAPDPHAPPNAGRSWVYALATAVLCSALLIWAQFSFEGLYDGDSYFHTRASQQLREHGVRKEFPQTGFSTWKESYSDKDFLFHALLIPFCGDGKDLVGGGKMAVAVFDVALLITLAVTLVRLRIRFAPLWILLLLGTHIVLLRRLMSVRPHLLGMTFLLLEIVLVLNGRWKTLFFVSAFHLLGHSSFVLLPGLLLAQFLAHLLRRKPLPWKACGAGILGLCLASLLHPYFPNNLTLAYDQIFQVARNAWGGGAGIPMDLFGRELDPIGIWRFGELVPGWLPTLAGLLGIFVLRGFRGYTARLLTLIFLTGELLVLTFLSSRFAFPFLVTNAILSGALWSDLAGQRPWRDWLVGGGLRPRLSVLLLATCLVLGQLRSNPFRLSEILRHQPTNEVFRPAVGYLDSVAAPDDIVYHNFWWDFNVLYNFRPHGRYVEALDPVFLYRYDQYLFDQMLRGYRGRSPDLYHVIAKSFGARWIYVQVLRKNLPFRTQLAGESRIRRVYGDNVAEVYKVD